MRKEYKLFQQGKPSRLNRERVEALEAVGMEWTAMGKNRSSAGDTGRPSFENRIQECKGFYAKYGHYRVSNPECADDATESFKQWVLRVRNAYQKWQQQKQDKEVFIAKHDKMLNEKRVQALNDIGFDWTADTDYLWNKRYEDMKEFYAQHGHFRAPRPSTTQEEEDGGSGDSDNTNSSRSNKNANGTDPWNGLYSWVQKTREAFRSLIARYPEALQNGNENNNEKAKQVFVWPKNIDRYMALTEERVKKLEDIGFEFIVRPSIPSFEQRLEELKQHKEKMGHANVRHDRMPDNEFRSLGTSEVGTVLLVVVYSLSAVCPFRARRWLRYRILLPMIDINVY